jgi:tetratricopeptide (TPR) repeat protein
MHSLTTQKKWPDMPYPGLRPFEISEEIDESLIFFGRQNQVFELIDRLAESHLVAVIGPSGCGKSSLVRVGLIPSLEYGYLYKAGARWVTTIMEPGSHPIQALSEALSDAVAKADASNGPKQHPKTTSEFKERLQKQPDALVEFSEEISPIFGERTNLLILVDQFEELFREDLTSPQEALDLINLILNVFNARPDRLYIVIAMRTDCLEQCAYYRGLPEALNQTHYLPPRLNDEELREAIINPVELEQFGGSIEPALLRQLLLEMSDEVAYDPDYLPLMQHALSWMWQTSKHNVSGDQTKPTLKLIDYQTFEGLAGSLSEHANKILNKLSAGQQKIAEVMFRLLSDLGSGGRVIRRVTAPERIAAVAGVSAEEVAPVIDAFTSKESCFVRWKDNRIRLDVTHESLIRKWDTLEKWVEEEAKSAEMYRKLERTARSWKARKASLLTGPELQNALDWEKNEKPTAEWAKRYGDDFGLVKELLEKSKKKKSRRRLRTYTVILLGNLLILAGVLWGLWTGYLKYFGQGQLRQIQTEYTRLIQNEKNVSDDNLKQGAKVFAQWNELAEAELILNRIHDPETREEAVEAVSIIFAKDNELQAAEKVTEIIPDFTRRAKVLKGVAVALSKSKTGKFENLLQVAKGIPDPEIKDQALEEMGVILSQAGKVEDAQRVADSIADPKRKAMVLKEMGVALAKASRVDEAQGVADILLDPKEKATVLIGVTEALIRERRIEGAQRVAWGILDPEGKSRALGDVAAALAKAGSFDEARRVAGGIPNQTARGKALRNVAETLAKAGNFDKAQEVAQRISDPEVRNGALGEVAVALVQAGKVEDAKRVAEKIADPKGKAMVLKNVAEALVRADKVEEAQEVSYFILDPEEKTWALNIVAVVFAKAGKVKNALGVIEDIPTQEDKARALEDVAEALVQADKVEEAQWVAEEAQRVAEEAQRVAEEAQRMAEDAQRVAETIDTLTIKTWAQRRMILALVRFGKVEDAQRVADSISDIETNIWALGIVAGALVQAGKVEDAQRVAESIPDSEAQTWALRKVAVALAKAGKVDEAQQVAEDSSSQKAKTTILQGVVEALIQAGKVDKAGEVANVIPDQAAKGKGLRKVAEALAKAGDFDKAQEVAEGISDPSARIEAIVDVAVALVQAGKEEETFKIVTIIDNKFEKIDKVEALARVAEEFANTRELRLSTKIIKYISDSASKLDTYSRIFYIYYSD